MEEKEVTTAELLESMNRSFSAVLERFDNKFDDLDAKFDTKIDALSRDLQSFKLETAIHFTNLESDLKSFKLETEDNFSEVKEKLDDLYDTDRGFDLRIAHLEAKVGI